MKVLKRFLPSSLFSRFLLIMLTPIILVQLIATYIFYDRHWESVSRHMNSSIVGELKLVLDTLRLADKEEVLFHIKNFNETLYLNIWIDYDKSLNQSTAISENYENLRDVINHKIPVPYVLETINDNSDLIFKSELPLGVLNVKFSAKRVANPSTYIFILWMVGSAGFLIVISVLFMRNQVRSISKLAIAAEDFGKGVDHEEFKPTGAEEVRQAGQAFIDMRERLQKQVEQRMEMLSGISHDLKTPLTRVKLQLAMMKKSKEIKDLQDDVTEMEKMVQEYLDFAKGQGSEALKEIKLADLLRSITAKYREKHKNINLKVPAGASLKVRPQAFKRAVTNIIDNALRYAENLNINVEENKNTLKITFDDDGTGIPASKREIVFKPFYRIDTSRNLDTGGVGLGLSITKDIIIGHGGEISMDESPQGGLRVLVVVPN